MNHKNLYAALSDIKTAIVSGNGNQAISKIEALLTDVESIGDAVKQSLPTPPPNEGVQKEALDKLAALHKMAHELLIESLDEIERLKKIIETKDITMSYMEETIANLYAIVKIDNPDNS